MSRRPRLIGLLAAGYLLVVGAVTLVNSQLNTGAETAVRYAFDGLRVPGLPGWVNSNELELLANIALFVPIGVFWMLLGGRTGRWPLAVVGSAALSAAIESIQWVTRSGVADVRDLVANAFGGALGAGLGWAALRSAELGNPS